MIRGVIDFLRALLRLSPLPTVPKGEFTVAGAPISIGQRVLIDWVTHVSGVMVSGPDRAIIYLTYPDGQKMCAVIQGDHRLAYSFEEGLRDRRTTQ